MVLKAWTGKKDKAATMKITAKVMALNVTESVFNVQNQVLSASPSNPEPLLAALEVYS